jgi:hypothetical protein
MIDTSSRRDAGSAGAGFRTTVGSSLKRGGSEPMHSSEEVRLSRLVPKRSELLKDAEFRITGGQPQVCAHAPSVLLQ